MQFQRLSKPTTFAILVFLVVQGQRGEASRIPRQFDDGDGGLSYDDYYIGTEPCTWTNAREDCRQWGEANGWDGVLLTIETKEERNFVRDVLSQSSTTYKGYWTDGVYSGDGWRWSSRKTPVETLFTDGIQGPEGPDRGPTFRSRLIYGIDGEEDYFSFDNGNNRWGYICKKGGGIRAAGKVEGQ